MPQRLDFAQWDLVNVPIGRKKLGINDLNVTGSGFTGAAGTGFTTVPAVGTAIAGVLGTNGLSLGVPPYLTTALASNAGSDFAGTNGAITGGSITVNSSGVSVALPAYLTTAMQSDASTAFAGTGTSATNASITLNTAGLAISVAAPGAGGAGTGFTSASTAGSDIVGTLSTNGLSLGIPAYLTTAMGSNAGSAFAGTAGAITGGSITVNTSGVSIALPAYLTTAMQSDASSAFAGTGATIVGGSLTVNTAGVNISLPAYLTTAMASNAPVVQSLNGSSGVLSISNAGIASISNNNSTIVVSARSISLNEVQDPTTDKVFNMGLNALQFQYAGGGSFSTNATRQGLFEIDVLGLLTDGADIVHIHQSVANPTIDLLHLQANGTNAHGLHILVSGATAGEINQPIYFTTDDPAFAIGSVPMVLGTQMSNVVSNLNAFYLQGKQSSQFAGTGTSATNASITLNSNGLAISVNAPGGGGAGTGFTSASTAGVDIVGTLSTNGLSIGVPAYLTTYVNDLTSGRAGVGETTSTQAGTALGLTVDTNGVNIAYPNWITTYVNDLTSGRAGVGETVGTIAGTDLALTVDTNGVSIAYPKWITTYVNDLTSGRAGTSTGATNILVTLDTNGIALSYDNANDAGTGFTSASTAGVDIKATLGTNGLSMGIPAYLTTAAAGAGATASLYPDVWAFPDFTTVSTYYSGNITQGGGGNSTLSGYTFSLYAAPMVLPVAVAFSQVRLVMSNVTAAGTGSASHVYSLGFYTNNASTLSLVKGYYGAIRLSQNSSNAWTYSVGTASTALVSSNAGGLAGISLQSIQSSQGNVNSSQQINGSSKLVRIDDGTMTTLTAGQYWVVYGNCWRSSGANVLSLAGVAQVPGVTQRSTGFLDAGVNTSASAPMFGSGWGAIQTTFTSASNTATWFALPNAIALSDMSTNSTAVQRYHFPFLRGI